MLTAITRAVSPSIVDCELSFIDRRPIDLAIAQRQHRDLLAHEGFPFTESKLVVVEVTSTDLNKLMSALLEAELNINYLYSFIPQPQGKSIVGLSMEDNDTAEQALRRHQFRVLTQTDISR